MVIVNFSYVKLVKKGTFGYIKNINSCIYIYVGWEVNTTCVWELK